MTIDKLELVDLAPSDYPEVTFRTVCSTGTYVRTLADDIARAVGGRAHLTALRRVRVGNLHVNDAVTVDEVVDAADAQEIDRILLAPGVVLSDFPEIRVDEAMAAAVRNGRELPGILMPRGEKAVTTIRISDRGGELIAVYRRESAALHPEVVLS